MRKFRLLVFTLICLCSELAPSAWPQTNIASAVVSQTYPPTSPCYSSSIRYSRSNNGLYLCGPNNTWTLISTGGVSGLGGSGTANRIAKFTSANTLGNTPFSNTTTDLSLGAGTGLYFAGSDAGTLAIVPGTTISSYTLTLPTAAGAANTYLKTDNSGNLSFALPISGLTSGFLPQAASATTLSNSRVAQGQKTLADNTATSLATFALASGSMSGGTIQYLVESSDGTELQTETGSVVFSFVNKSASYTTGISPHDTENVASSGTLTVTWTITTGSNVVDVKVNADTSLTPTTLRITYVLTNLGQGAMALN